MMSDSFNRTVDVLTEDRAVTNDEVRAALTGLDNELYRSRLAGAPVPLDRFRLRQILRAVAFERGMTDQCSWDR